LCMLLEQIFTTFVLKDTLSLPECRMSLKFLHFAIFVSSRLSNLPGRGKSNFALLIRAVSQFALLAWNVYAKSQQKVKAKFILSHSMMLCLR
jgi:hypothetical protein